MVAPQSTWGRLLSFPPPFGYQMSTSKAAAPQNKLLPKVEPTLPLKNPTNQRYVHCSRTIIPSFKSNPTVEFGEVTLHFSKLDGPKTPRKTQLDWTVRIIRCPLSHTSRARLPTPPPKTHKTLAMLPRSRDFYQIEGERKKAEECGRDSTEDKTSPLLFALLLFSPSNPSPAPLKGEKRVEKQRERSSFHSSLWSMHWEKNQPKSRECLLPLLILFYASRLRSSSPAQGLQ